MCVCVLDFGEWVGDILSPTWAHSKKSSKTK